MMGRAEVVSNASSPAPCSRLRPSEHRYEGAQSRRGASKHPVEKLTPPACPGTGFLAASLVRE